MARNTRPLERIQAYKLSDNYRFGKYLFENFKGGQQPFHFQVSSGLPVAPTTTTITQGATVFGMTPFGGYYEFFAATDQDLLPTGVAGTGLNIACDLVDNEALEIVPGGNSSSSRYAFTVGTDTNFFFKTKWNLTDVAGSDQAILCGWRKQEAFAVMTSILTTGDGIYDTFAGIGFADATGTDIHVIRDLNNSGSTTVLDTLFNATNSQVLSLEMRVVGKKGVFLINGVAIGNPIAKDGDGTAITSQSTISGPSADLFDTGDVLVPFIMLRHDTGIANGSHLVEWEAGHLVEVGLDPNNE